MRAILTGRRTGRMLIAVAVVLFLMGMKAHAAEAVNYWDTVAGEQKSVTDYTTVTADMQTLGKKEESSWYVLKGQHLNIRSRIEVKGDVKLVLMDGSSMSATRGITVADGDSLSIYQQRNGDEYKDDSSNDAEHRGSLIATASDDPYDAIIGGSQGGTCGDINIYGGKIETGTKENEIGIGGGGNSGNSAEVRIAGGVVCIQSARHAVGGLGSGHLDISSSSYNDDYIFCATSGIAIDTTVLFDGQDNPNLDGYYCMKCEETGEYQDICRVNTLSNLSSCQGVHLQPSRKEMKFWDPTANDGEGGYRTQTCTILNEYYLFGSTDPDFSNSLALKQSVDNLNEGYYVLLKDLTLPANAPQSFRMNINDHVHLILADGATLTEPRGIAVRNGDKDGSTSFTLYQEHEEGYYTGEHANARGTLNADMTVNTGTYIRHNAAIGGNTGKTGNQDNWVFQNQTQVGDITINGGHVIAKASNCSAGIGGSPGQPIGTITINGGIVEASGGPARNNNTHCAGAGIGECVYVDSNNKLTSLTAGGSVNLNGGQVKATGHAYQDDKDPGAIAAENINVSWKYDTDRYMLLGDTKVFWGNVSFQKNVTAKLVDEEGTPTGRCSQDDLLPGSGKSISKVQLTPAGNPVSYWDPISGEQKREVCEVLEEFDFTDPIGEDGQETWFTIDKNTSANDTMQVRGNVNLIIPDDTQLDLFSTTSKIEIAEGASLSIYQKKPDQDYVKHDNRGCLYIHGSDFYDLIIGDALILNGTYLTGDNQLAKFMKLKSLTVNQGKLKTDCEIDCNTITISSGSVDLGGTITSEKEVVSWNTGYEKYHFSRFRDLSNLELDDDKKFMTKNADVYYRGSKDQGVTAVDWHPESKAWEAVELLPADTYTFHVQDDGSYQYLLPLGPEFAAAYAKSGTEGSGIAENVAAPTYEKHVFAGWATDQAGQSAFVPDEVYPSEGMDLYATWKATFSFKTAIRLHGGGEKDFTASLRYIDNETAKTLDEEVVTLKSNQDTGHIFRRTYDEAGTYQYNLFQEMPEDEKIYWDGSETRIIVEVSRDEANRAWDATSDMDSRTWDDVYIDNSERLCLCLEAPSGEKVYDGTPLQASNDPSKAKLWLSDIGLKVIGQGWPEGLSLKSIDVFGSQTDVGKGESKITGYQFVYTEDEKEYDVTNCFIDQNHYTTQGTLYVKNTWTKALTCADITYGESPAPSAEAVAGTVSYLYSDSKDGEYSKDVPTNAGDYYVKAVAAGPDGCDYDPIESEPVAFTINRADVEIKSIPTARKLIYNGQQQELVTDGEVVGGYYTYEHAAGEYDRTIPTGQSGADGSNVYSVAYRLVCDENHKFSDPDLNKLSGEMYVTIDQKSLTAATIDAEITDTDTPVYNGTEVTRNVEVKDSETGKTLRLGTDYQVTMLHNINAGNQDEQDSSKQPMVQLKGEGNYSGLRYINFTILPKSIEDESITVGSIANQTYSGSGLEPTVSIKDTALDQDLTTDDYAVTYSKNTNVADTPVVTITGQGNYSGSRSTSFRILKAEAVLTAPTLPTLTYSGKEQKLLSGGSVVGGHLEYATSVDGEYSSDIPKAVDAGDYDVWYKVVCDGNHKYDETAVKLTNTIAQKSIKDESLSINISDPTYSGSGLEPAVEITDAGRSDAKLSSPEDFTVDSYTNNVNVADSPVVMISGKGNYTGRTTASFHILKADAVVDAPAVRSDLTYNGRAQSLLTVGSVIGGHLEYATSEKGAYSQTVPSATAAGAYDSWYKVICDDNHKYAEAAVKLTTSIDRKAITASDLLISIENPTYNGSSLEPAVRIVDSFRDNVSLLWGTDYTVSYAENVNVADTPVVTITGQGNYTGSRTTSFHILPKDLGADYTIDAADTPWTGAPVTTAVTVRDGLTLLKDGTDFQVEYSNNTEVSTEDEEAQAKVTLIGNYSGEVKTASFRVTDSKRAAKEQIDAEVASALKKNFKKGLKKARSKKYVKKGIVIKKLKRKKYYYVRVRAYKNLNGMTVYGNWSAVKKIKVK